MTFNLVLDEPAEGDVIEEHHGIKFTVAKNVHDNFGPFTLSSAKHGSQVYLQLLPAKEMTGGGCDTCPSCG